MNKNSDKTKEQLLAELTELGKKSKEREDSLKASNQQLKSNLRQTEVLQQTIADLNRAQSLEEIYAIAADGLIKILQADRSSILLFDDDDKVHFKAWKNLSQKYLHAVDGHSPWQPKDMDAQPLCFPDVSKADFSKKINDAIRGEGIAALIFMPLKGTHQLLGKFMVYFDAPHECSKQELNLALVLAQNLAAIISRTRALEETRRTETKYRLIFEQFQDLYYRMDMEGTIVELSPSLKRLTGYEREELIGKPITTVYPNPADREDLLRELCEKGSVENYTLTLQKKNGEKVIASANSHIVTGENGEPVGIEGTLRDITERKQAEEALKESEDRLSKTMMAANDGMWDWNLKTNEVYFDPRYYEMADYAVDEFPHRLEEFQKRVHPEDVDYVMNEAQNHLEGKTDRFIVEFRFKKKNGDWLWIMGRGIIVERDDQSNPIRFIGTHTDITERKLAEEEIRKLSRVIESTTQAVIISDLETNIVYVNPALLDLGGFNHQNELIGKSLLTYTDEKGRKKLQDEIIPALLQVGFYRCEMTLKKKDKSLFPAELSCALITDEKGAPIYLTALFEDITERKQAEEELKENEKKYRELSTLLRLMADNMPDMLWAKNLNKEFIFVNKAICTGLLNAKDTHEPLGKTDMFFAQRERNAHPGNPEWHTFGEVCRDSDAATLEARKPMHFDEFGNVKGKFLFLDVHKAPLYDGDGKLIGTVGSARDVTAAKEAEKQLSKLSTAVTQSPSIIIITDTDGNIEYVNPKFTEITGYSMEEVIGQNPLTLKTGEHSDEMYKALWKTISPGKTWRGEMHYKKKNGELFWEMASISPIFDEKGKIINFVDVAEDITKKKKTEQELIKAKEKAEESDRLKSAFLANMSHEIRTPMNSILGFTGLLKEPQLTGEEQDEYIRIIEKSGNRLLNTINDIIDISKIEAGEIKVSKTEVSVNEILEEQYHIFYQEAKSKGIELHSKPSLPDRETIIITDKHKLEGILTNLIKNAIKFTEKGSITFGYDMKTLEGKKYFEFYVKDTGIGIPADRIAAVFNRFEQADIEDRKVFEGSGLGLAIAKSYVEMLGGKISVKSKEGAGSTFTFSLPYTKQLEKESNANENINKEPQTSFSHLSLIIAEDDETSRMFYDAIFKNKFKKITYTTTGKETIEKFRKNPDTDIILMDIRMPDMNGYDATREIRKFNTDVVIIAQTAFGLVGDKEKSIEAGCDDYVSKPVKKEMLFEKIRACLDRKSH